MYWNYVATFSLGFLHVANNLSCGLLLLLKEEAEYQDGGGTSLQQSRQRSVSEMKNPFPSLAHMADKIFQLTTKEPWDKGI